MKLEIISALGDRTYRRYALGHSASMVGLWMQRVAISWLTWELSHSTVWLGLVAAADLLPAVFLSSIFGSLADGYNRLSIVRAAQCATVLQALVLSGLTLAGLINVEALFVLALILGIAISIDQPARLSLLREIAPSGYLPSAIVLNSISFHLARFIGPVLSGALIAINQTGLAFLASALSLGVFAAVLFTMHRPDLRPVRGKPMLLADTSAGFRYIGTNKIVQQALIVMLTMGVGVGGVTQLLPAIAETFFARGVGGFVELTVASGLGAVLAGMLMLALPPKGRTGIHLSLCLLAAGVSLAVFATTSLYLVGICALFAASFASTYAGVTSQTLVNVESRPDMLGRVMGVYGSLVRGSPAIGGFLIGFAATLTGFWPLVIFCGAWTGLYGVLLLARRKRV